MRVPGADTRVVGPCYPRLSTRRVLDRRWALGAHVAQVLTPRSRPVRLASPLLPGTWRTDGRDSHRPWQPQLDASPYRAMTWPASSIPDSRTAGGIERLFPIWTGLQRSPASTMPGTAAHGRPVSASTLLMIYQSVVCRENHEGDATPGAARLATGTPRPAAQMDGLVARKPALIAFPTHR